MDHILTEKIPRQAIVGATSGDTGSAAIEAFKGRDTTDIFILHPQGRTSPVQRLQMTTVRDANVHNIALDGTFDDCQNIVKGLFNNHKFRDRVRLSGVNSINWGRIVAQIVYYFTAAVSLGSPGRTGRSRCPRATLAIFLLAMRQAHGPADRATDHCHQCQ